MTRLWLYLTSSLDASRLSAKITLAQMPDGAQLWDWNNVGFVEGGALAFQPDDGGYHSEAALPCRRSASRRRKPGCRSASKSGARRRHCSWI
ncbi:MAG: hypothetical protein U0521_01830 [Anaerolineae bacterium]